MKGTKFRKTKVGIAMCPFFIWTSEDVFNHSEHDVSLAFCNHPNNKDECEGNCSDKQCPLLKEEVTSSKT